MKKLCTLIIGGVLLSSSAQADSTGANFTVKITIQKECSVTSPGEIDLGIHGAIQPIATTVSKTGNFTVTCSKGTGYTIAFAGANDVTGTPPTHWMKGAIGANTDVVQYLLVDFTTGTASAPLGGANVISDAGTGTVQNKTLRATVTNYSTAVQPDTYTDTMTMTVTY